MDHAGAAPVFSLRQLAIKDLAKRRCGLDRQDLASAVDQLERQPAGAGTDLDDPVDAFGQPIDDAGVEPLLVEDASPDFPVRYAPSADTIPTDQRLPFHRIDSATYPSSSS
jgi:hypothetical protein